MNFFQVIFRGLWRRPLRTGLTLIGISIGIGAVVALVGMSRGFESSWTASMKSRGTDIVINNLGGSLTPKPFPADYEKQVAEVPGIAATCGLLVELMSVESSEMTIVSAREWGGFSWSNLKIVSGRLPQSGEEKAVVLGTSAAEVLKKKVGDPLQLETEELTVVGIFEGGAMVENGSVVLSLSVMQKVMNTEGKMNIIDVRVKQGTSEEETKQICQEIQRRLPDVRAQAGSDHIRNSQGYKIINAMSWGTSLLAVFVGVLGVMNTMLMTVFERKQEISILLALGWRRSRVVRMIICESAFLGLFGGIVGVGLGALGVKALERAPTIRGFLQPEFSLHIVLLSIGLALIVGILSGLYPAWRSSRLNPAMALQG